MKSTKVSLISLDAAVEIQVVGVDVGDHGDGRRELQERAVRLVGLGHQELPLAQLGVGPQGVELAADDDGRVDAAVGQDRGHHGGGGGLAVGAGDGDAVLHAHQFGQHLGPRDDRDHPRLRLEDLRVVVLHRAWR